MIDEYLNNIKKYGELSSIILKTYDKDLGVLKELADNLLNKIGKGIVFLANIKDDNVNFICRSNCEIDAGLTVKRASLMSSGNGGGSPTFAQGGGKTIDSLDEIFSLIEQELKNIKN